MEAHLRDSLKCDEGGSFMTMLGISSNKCRLTTEQFRALSAMASLRNAIGHGEYYGGRPIAEPVREVVDQIDNLSDQDSPIH